LENTEGTCDWHAVPSQWRPAPKHRATMTCWSKRKTHERREKAKRGQASPSSHKKNTGRSAKPSAQGLPVRYAESNTWEGEKRRASNTRRNLQGASNLWGKTEQQLPKRPGYHPKILKRKKEGEESKKSVLSPSAARNPQYRLSRVLSKNKKGGTKGATQLGGREISGTSGDFEDFDSD